MGSKRGAQAFVALVIAFAATPLQAQEAAPAPTADTLFQEGRSLYEAGDFDAACAKLAESERVEPSVGTLGLLASCHEQQGRLATAWREYLETAELAARMADDRGAYALDRAAALEPRVPRLQVHVAQPPQGLEVSRDGVPLGAAELNVDVRLDPGPVRVVARAPGRREFTSTTTLQAGVRTIIEVPDLAPLVAPPPPKPHPVTPAPAAAAPDPHGAGPRVPLAIAAGVVGLAGIGVGTGFGLAAIDTNAESVEVHDTCAGAACAEGRRLREQAQQSATISTIAFGAGIAGLAVGAVLLLTGREGHGDRKTTASAAPGAWVDVDGRAGGATLGGRW